jgi:hypothetical protein
MMAIELTDDDLARIENMVEDVVLTALANALALIPTEEAAFDPARALCSMYDCYYMDKFDRIKKEQNALDNKGAQNVKEK